MNKLRDLFYGKCGFDALNKAIAAAGLIFLILASALNMAPLAFGFLTCLILCLYRALSVDLKARNRESAALMRIVNGLTSAFRLRLRMVKEIGTHKYFRCVSCGTWLRVPKGRGKINARCSKCGVSMIKKV